LAGNESQIIGQWIGLNQLAPQRPIFDFPLNVKALTVAVHVKITRRFDRPIDIGQVIQISGGNGADLHIWQDSRRLRNDERPTLLERAVVLVYSLAD
jgi:hypothetical protein